MPTPTAGRSWWARSCARSAVRVTTTGRLELKGISGLAQAFELRWEPAAVQGMIALSERLGGLRVAGWPRHELLGDACQARVEHEQFSVELALSYLLRKKSW